MNRDYSYEDGYSGAGQGYYETGEDYDYLGDESFNTASNDYPYAPPSQGVEEYHSQYGQYQADHDQYLDGYGQNYEENDLYNEGYDYHGDGYNQTASYDSDQWHEPPWQRGNGARGRGGFYPRRGRGGGDDHWPRRGSGRGERGWGRGGERGWGRGGERGWGRGGEHGWGRGGERGWGRGGEHGWGRGGERGSGRGGERGLGRGGERGSGRGGERGLGRGGERGLGRGGERGLGRGGERGLGRGGERGSGRGGERGLGRGGERGSGRGGYSSAAQAPRGGDHRSQSFWEEPKEEETDALGSAAYQYESTSNTASVEETEKEEVKEDQKEEEEEGSSDEDTGYCKYCKISFTDDNKYFAHTRGLLHTQKVLEVKKVKEGDGNPNEQEKQSVPVPVHVPSAGQPLRTLDKEKVEVKEEKVEATKEEVEAMKEEVEATEKVEAVEKEVEGGKDGKESEWDRAGVTANAWSQSWLSRKRKELPDHDAPDNVGRSLNKKEFVCKLCNISCTSEGNLEMHLMGGKHKSNMEKFKDECSEDGVMTLKRRRKAETCTLPSKLLKKVKEMNAPVVGMKYITEYQRERDPKYTEICVCNLCQIKCDLNTIIPHMLGLKHRFQYMKEHHPDSYEHVKTFKVRSDASEIMADLVRDIVADDADAKPIVKLEKVDKEDFVYAEDIRDLKKAAETEVEDRPPVKRARHAPPPPPHSREHHRRSPPPRRAPPDPYSRPRRYEDYPAPPRQPPPPRSTRYYDWDAHYAHRRPPARDDPRYSDPYYASRPYSVHPPPRAYAEPPPRTAAVPADEPMTVEDRLARVRQFLGKKVEPESRTAPPQPPPAPQSTQPPPSVPQQQPTLFQQPTRPSTSQRNLSESLSGARSLAKMFTGLPAGMREQVTSHMAGQENARDQATISSVLSSLSGPSTPSLISSEEEAKMALEVSRSLTEALLAFRMKSNPTEVRSMMQSAGLSARLETAGHSPASAESRSTLSDLPRSRRLESIPHSTAPASTSSSGTSSSTETSRLYKILGGGSPWQTAGGSAVSAKSAASSHGVPFSSASRQSPAPQPPTSRESSIYRPRVKRPSTFI